MGKENQVDPGEKSSLVETNQASGGEQKSSKKKIIIALLLLVVVVVIIVVVVLLTKSSSSSNDPPVCHPVVTSFVPSSAIEGESSYTFYAVGSGFTQVSTFQTLRSLNKQFYSNSSVAPHSKWTFVNSTHLRITLPGNATNGYYAPRVNNVLGSIAGCAAQNKTVLFAIRPLLLILFAAPQTVYQPVSMQALIFLTGFQTNGTTNATRYPHQLHHMTLQQAGGLETNVTYTNISSSQVRLTLAGLQPGTVTIRAYRNDGWDAVYSGLTVVSQNLLPLLSVTPSFVYGTTGGPITLDLNTTNAGVVFTGHVAIYITPSTGALAGKRTIPLLGVVLLSSSKLNAVVPSGLDVTTYDIIAVNGDRTTVGVLRNALTLTAKQLPFIESVVPSVLTNPASGLTETLFITGQRLNGTAALNVSLECQAAGVAPAKLMLPSLNAVIVSVTADLVKVTLTKDQIGGLVKARLCNLRLKQVGGADTVFESIGVQSSSANLVEFSTTSPWEGTVVNNPLPAGRRGAAAVIIRPTARDKYLVVIGGDASSVDGFNSQGGVGYSSVVFASITGGVVNTWSTQRYPFHGSKQIAFHRCSTLGMFVYCVGGNDAQTNTPVNSVFRAQVLDPIKAPIVTPDLALYQPLTNHTSLKGNLTTGAWYYRVSAVFPASYDVNPLGESLPSEVTTIVIPVLSVRLQVLLSWSAVHGATSYNVYRTKTADQTVASMVLIATTTSLTFADAGRVPPAGDISVLPPGTLGQWAILTSLPLSTPRMKFGMTLAADQWASKPSKYFLYVLGGSSVFSSTTSTGLLNTYEVLTITRNFPSVASTSSSEVETHSYSSSWTTGTNTLSVKREGLDASVLTGKNNAVIPGADAYVLAGGGRSGFTTSRQFSDLIEAGKVNLVTGELTFQTLVSAMGSGIGEGYCMGVQSNFLYYWGAKAGVPDSNCASATFCQTSTGSCNGRAAPPDLTSMNSCGGGGDPTVKRMYAACVSDGPLMFVVGGFTDSPTNGPSTSVKRAQCCS